MRSADAEVLSERLDPDDRGKVDREALVSWLTSGLDPLQVRPRNLSRKYVDTCTLFRLGFLESCWYINGMVVFQKKISQYTCIEYFKKVVYLVYTKY